MGKTPKEQPVRAIGYARISKSDAEKTEAEQQASIRTQEDAIRRYCDGRGWDLSDVRCDVQTGANEDRPGWQETLSLLNQRKADRVVVVRLDRISREADVLLGYLKPKAYRWTIDATEQGIDTSTAGGWLQAAMFAVFAEYERLQLAERTAAALAYKRAMEGIVPGPKSSVPESTDDYILSLFAEEDLGPTAIGRRLDAEGYPTPGTSKNWHPDQVKAAIRRAELRAALAERQVSA